MPVANGNIYGLDCLHSAAQHLILATVVPWTDNQESLGPGTVVSGWIERLAKPVSSASTRSLSFIRARATRANATEPLVEGDRRMADPGNTAAMVIRSMCILGVTVGVTCLVLGYS